MIDQRGIEESPDKNQGDAEHEVSNNRERGTKAHWLHC